MHDSALLETATWVLNAGADLAVAEAYRDAADVDLTFDLYFADGYTLDQVGAAIDVLDTIVTASFVAVEARAREIAPEDIFNAMGAGELAVTWTVESAEAGSLRIRAAIRRVGHWLCDHRHQVFTAAHVVLVLAPHIGIPVAEGLHIAVVVIDVAVDSLIWLRERKVQRAKIGTDPTEAAPPTPQVTVDARPVEPDPPEQPRSAEPPISRTTIHIDGLNAARKAFREGLLTLEGVRWVTVAGGELLHVGRLAELGPLDPAAVEELAKTSGVTVELIDPPVYLPPQSR